MKKTKPKVEAKRDYNVLARYLFPREIADLIKTSEEAGFTQDKFFVILRETVELNEEQIEIVLSSDIKIDRLRAYRTQGELKQILRAFLLEVIEDTLKARRRAKRIKKSK